MISASHNPAHDNGIKFLAFGGQKLSQGVETEIEAELLRASPRPVGAGEGRIRQLTDAEDRYLAHLLSSLPHRLEGLTVVLDYAHGAASHCSPGGLPSCRGQRRGDWRRAGRNFSDLRPPVMES
jgi:phosphoglucosamine mutase